jgi:hypothetical protein
MMVMICFVLTCSEASSDSFGFDPKRNFSTRKDYETDAISLTLMGLKIAAGMISKWGAGRLGEPRQGAVPSPSRRAYRECGKVMTCVENVQAVILVYIQRKGPCRP